MSATSQRLGDVATFVRGITFKPTDVLDEVTSNSVGCMRTKNVQAQLDESDVWFLPENFVANKNQILQEGDLLVSTANSWNLVGKACWVPKLNYVCTFGGFISALRATESVVDRRYLYYWFTSKKIQTKLRSFGNKTTNISNLSIKRANDLVIPLPPLAEQKSIALVLDKATEIKAKSEQAIAKLDVLASAMFEEVVSTSRKNNALGDLCDVRDGTHDSPKYVVEGFPLITSKNIVDGKIDKSTANFINEEDYKEICKRSKVDCGDILMPMIGTIGNPVIVEELAPKFAIKNVALIKFKSNSPKNTYINAFLKSNHFYQYVNKLSRGGTQKFLSLGDIRKLPIPMLTAEGEAELCKQLQRTAMLREQAIVKLAKADSLVASLQHQAFKTGFNA